MPQRDVAAVADRLATAPDRPSRSCERVRKALGLEDRRPSTRPQAPTIASQGLTSTAGSRSTGRAPGFSSRDEAVVQAGEAALSSPRRGRGRRTAARRAIERSRTQRLLDAAEPAHEARERERGMRLVSRKFRSCAAGATLRARSWRCHASGVRSVARMAFDGPDTCCSTGSAPPPARASLPRAQGAASSCRAPSTPRWPATRAWPGASRALVPGYAYDEERFFARDDAPDGRGRSAGARRSRGLAALYRERFAADARAHRRGASGISDLQFTGRLPRALPVQRATCASTCASAPSCSPPRASRVDRPRRQPLLRPHRLLRRQPLRPRLLQGLHRRGRGARRARSARCSAPTTPCVADNVRRLQRDLRARRGLVPHVGHRGGDAGGAAGALPHAAHAPRALLRRLPRLVGGRAARRRQPAAAARDLHAARHGRARRCACCDGARDIACVLVNPLQALHPNARRAGRLARWSTASRSARLRPRRLHRLAARAARGLHASAASC